MSEHPGLGEPTDVDATSTASSGTPASSDPEQFALDDPTYGLGDGADPQPDGDGDGGGDGPGAEPGGRG